VECAYGNQWLAHRRRIQEPGDESDPCTGEATSLGKTTDGRRLLITFILRDADQLIRVISARDMRQSFSVTDDSLGLDEFHHPPIRILPAVAGLFITAERCASIPVRIVDIDGARAQIGGHLPCVVKILR
jgi:hypothetical protein